MKAETKGKLKIPESLRKAMDGGVLTLDQLRQLIGLEAEAIGLDFDSAIRGARNNTLPHNDIGSDLSLIIQLLPNEEQRR